MSKKKILDTIKIVVPAGKAGPTPAIGSALGKRKVNIMEFCKQFNAATQKLEQSVPTPVVVTVYEDSSFTFVMKSPPVSYFIRKAAGITKGSSATQKDAAVGRITSAQCMEIAKEKIKDMNAYEYDSACSMVMASAKSMGVEVV